MKKSIDNLKFLKTLYKMYPLDNESKSRIKRDIHLPPMVQPLSEFFAKNGNPTDQRVFLNADDLPSESYKTFVQVFKEMDFITETEWNSGKMATGEKLKKTIQDAYTSDLCNKTQKGEMFDRYLKPFYEKIQALKTSTKESTQMLITKNPLDIFFCSSSMSFTSCMDVLKSETEGRESMQYQNMMFSQAFGLINHFCNPAYFMVAKTDGWRFMMYDGVIYKIPNVVSRTMALITEKGELHTIRWYNGESIPNNRLSKIMKVDKYTREYTTCPFVPYSVKYGRERGKAVPMAYVDTGSYTITQDKKAIRVTTSSTSIFHNGSGALTKLNDTFSRGGGTHGSRDITSDFNPRIEAPSYLRSLYSGNGRLTCHVCGEVMEDGKGLQDQNALYCKDHVCKIVKENNKVDTWFGVSEEKTYKVYTTKKHIKIFPQSKVVEFLKNKDIYVNKNKLFLKGVA
jgi:hypothetical protein